MRLFFDTGSRAGDIKINKTRVLNPQECGFNKVGCTLKGKLTISRPWSMRDESHLISYVIPLRTVKVRGAHPNQAVEMDLDIYLTDGTVIEVFSNDRTLLLAAMKHAPQADIRDQYRAARKVNQCLNNMSQAYMEMAKILSKQSSALRGK